MGTIADGRRRRSWSVDEKRRMVEESLEPGASMSVVARRHDVNANLLFSWRRQFQDGLLMAETALVPVEISQPPVEIAAPPAERRSSAPGRSRPGMIEIALERHPFAPARVDRRGVLRQVIDVLSGR